MKKMTIAIAFCAVLALTACGKTGDTESSNPTSATEPMTEQNTATYSGQQTPPADQSVETGTGTGTSTQTDQAAFEAGNVDSEKGEMKEGTNKE